MKLLCTTIVTTLALVGTSMAGKAQILNVPGDYPTIESAVIAANNGDTVLIAAGTYYESDIQLAEFDGTGGKDIAISGETELDGSPAVTIQVSGGQRAFKDYRSSSHVGEGLIFENLIIQGGVRTPVAVALYCSTTAPQASTTAGSSITTHPRTVVEHYTFRTPTSPPLPPADS